MARRLSWPIWADFGQAWEAQNGSKMTELGAKMRPSWRQDGPRWGLSGHLEADWEASWALWAVLGTIFAEMEALGAILGHLGEKLGYLGRSWRQVGTLLAGCWDKDGEDEPR